VLGNVYSNGPITGAGNTITGNAVSAGPGGLIDDIHTTGDGLADSILDSAIDGDAYYDADITGTTVGGASYPSSSPQATTTLPIPDSLILEWEVEAAAGEIIASTDPRCDGDKYTIDSDVTLGPVKIECDVEIKKKTVVTLAGPIWIEGDLVIQNNPTIQVDLALSGKSIQVIADKPSDRDNSSTIKTQNSPTFKGAGDGSYVLLISYNTSSENGGGVKAIEIDNSSEGGDLVVYAAHGEILLQNNISLSEVSGYKLHLKNSAEAVYESGLTNLIFTSGPSGGYTVDDWEETY
jgi:hypothetical protein